MLKHRSKRILLPLLTLGPLILLSLVAAVSYGVELIEMKSEALEFAAQVRAGTAPSPSIKTAHLWFLYYLCFFIPLAVFLLKTGALRPILYAIKAFPKTFFIAFPVLLLPALMAVQVPHPAPLSLIPQLWSFGFYGMFFVVGFILYPHRHVLDDLQPWWGAFLVMGVIAYAIFFHLLPDTIMRKVPVFPEPVTKGIVALLEAMASGWLTIGFLLLGKKYLNTSSRLTRYISDASYWIYLIHLPVLFFIQFNLVPVQTGVLEKFILASFGTITIGMLTYMTCVRWTFLGVFLNGKRKPVI